MRAVVTASDFVEYQRQLETAVRDSGVERGRATEFLRSVLIRYGVEKASHLPDMLRADVLDRFKRVLELVRPIVVRPGEFRDGDGI